ncbi:MAG: flagellar basal body rod protein FlgG [Lentimonas sp.]|jgi:flagellar basal body rod protein FlgG
MNTIQTGNLYNLYQSASKGSEAAQLQAFEASEKIAAGNLEPRTMVQLNESAQLYKLNAKLVSVADQMAGTVLNMRA